MKLPSGHTARALDEWIGASPNAAIPERVKIRVFERFGGKCAITGRKLRPGEWDCDHITPLKDGGQHRESNLQPVLRSEHRKKTAAEKSARAKVDRVKRKHQLPRVSKWAKRGDYTPRPPKQLTEGWNG